MPLLAYFSLGWVGLGWGVRRFHNTVYIYIFKPNIISSIANTNIILSSNTYQWGLRTTYSIIHHSGRYCNPHFDSDVNSKRGSCFWSGWYTRMDVARRMHTPGVRYTACICVHRLVFRLHAHSWNVARRVTGIATYMYDTRGALHKNARRPDPRPQGMYQANTRQERPSP